ncbi:MAG: diguanylate cyclase [Candidatus Aminicenantes bacterium]|nr:MAG: diguanylate cyclase [Candidatus Aminicenantes bacterium]
MSKKISKEELQKLLYTDELTRIHNLRYLREQIPDYLENANKQGDPVAFLLFDIDDFKKINDNYGHLVGDKALAHFIKIITQKTSEKGIAIRYAGDEFILVMPKLDKQKAKQLGEEIQRSISETPLEIDHNEIAIGCSIGISLYPRDGKNWKLLFEKADEALYFAKEKGKNKIVIHPDSGKLFTPSKLNSILDNPFIVGRESLIHFMEEHLSQEGNPQLFPVLLGGEGVGKTRLLRFAQNIAQEKLAFTLFTKGYPYWQSDLYGAAFSALENLFEQQRVVSDHVFSRIDDKYKIILKPHLPSWYIKEVEGVDEVGETDRMALFEALTQTFFIIRELGDGAVLLDDVDRIDTPSLQLFGSQFGPSDKGGRLHFLSTICSSDLTTAEEKLLSLLESMPELTSGGEVQNFQLEPLTVEDIQQLAAHLFSGKQLSPESAAALLDNSAGNPFFIVEALSGLLLRGNISAKNGEWDLSTVKPKDMPKILQNMIKERLMHMEKEALHVLKMASILGERIQPQQLAEMSKLKLQQVLNALGNAKRNLLIEECLNPGEFVFSHRIIRSAFYSLMNDGERRHYHDQAAKIEKKHSADTPERIVGRLAYHFHNAGQLEQAAEMFSALKSQMNAVHISRGSRNILKKRIHSVSLAKESVLETEALSEALMIGRTFRSVIQNLRLYPKENENVKNSLQQFMNHLTPFLAENTEVLSISLTPETILFNGTPLPPYLEDTRLTQDLYATLNSFGLQGVLFMRGITQEEAVQFIEVFKRLPEDVIGQWDVILEQLGISNILPDRKIFVAVSERKIVLDEQEFLAQTIDGEGKQDVTSAPSEAPPLPDDQLMQLKILLEQFSKEKQDFLNALQSSDISKKDIQDLVQILNQSQFENLARSVQTPDRFPTLDEEPAPLGPDYTDVKPDFNLVKELEEEISFVFEDLGSENTEIRAKAAALIAAQPPAILAEEGFKAITSDLPIKIRRLIARVIKQAGEYTVNEFFGKIHVGMNSVSLNKVIRLCDIFADYPGLIPLLRNIALNGPLDTIPTIVNILQSMPGNEVNAVLLEIFEKATGKNKWDIIPLFAERKIQEATPLLLEFIQSAKTWEKERDISLQHDICRTLGVLRSPEATEALIRAIQAPMMSLFHKTKPDSIRAIATWALTQLPKDARINKALTKLKKDRSHLVRKAVELAEIIHK